MADCSCNAIAKIFGHKLPSRFSELKQYESEIEKSQVMVTIQFRESKGGKLKSCKCKIHKKLAKNFQEACKEIADNPNVAFVWGGSYCFRKMNNGKSNPPASIHSLGCAFDVNVDQNPYKRDNLKDDALHMRSTNHPIVQAFVKRGWVWGGTWSTPDYMHFEFTNANADIDSSDNDFPSYTPSNEDRSFSFESSGSGASYNGGAMSFINNSPNTVYQLASNGEKSNTLKINDDRKNQFTSLRETLKGNMLNMGRDIIESPEMYNSSILKSSQSAKTLRTPQTNQNKTEEKKSESA